MDKTVADPMIGRVLDGRYRVGPRIARGGMATVYEAVDERLDRVCAVKVMHQGMGDDEDFASRFVREARSAARLSHANVVSVFDQGDDDGTIFLVMEYIPGHTLRDVIRSEAPMSPAKALGLIEPVLSALAAAHQSGMIHRDVKPENVLLADDGRIKVADFGLARAISAETHHTATGGLLIGTVSYLAPELVVDGRADARSDVYSAGVLLYELLTGRKPHEGDTPIQVAYKHVHEDVPPPSLLEPGIPPYVDALVARATARDRELRPADARVLLQFVRRVRAAVDAGAADDPELTADLMPRVFFAAPSGIDYVDDLPTRQQPAVAREATSIIGTLPPPPVTTPPPARRGRREPRTVRPAAPPAGRPPERDQRRTGYRRSRRGPLLLVLVLVLAVLAAGAGWYFGVGRYTTAPGVIDLPRAQAEQRVEAAGLSFEVGGEAYSETVTKGAVISTDPSAGERILEDGTVTAVISRGPERHAVPVLRGRTVDDASEALENASLDVGKVTRAFNERVPDGIVLRSTPTANTELKRDTAVALVVSKGPKPIKLADYTDKRAADVIDELTGKGLDVSTEAEFSEDVDEGRVISQSEDPGAVLYRGDDLALVVSKGPPLVEVPSTVGAGVEAARQQLKDAGFKVRTERSSTYIGIKFVLSQDPPAGTMLAKGSVVTLFLV